MTDQNNDQQQQTDQLPDDVEALKAALQAERAKYGTLLNENKRVKAARNELTTKMKTWNHLEERGLTPERVAELEERDRQEQLARARGENGGGEVDRLLDQTRQQYERQLQERDTQLAAHAQMIEQLTIDRELSAALDPVVNPGLKVGAAKLHRDKVRLVEDPDNGGLRCVVPLDDTFVSLSEYVKSWASSDEASAWLKPSLASGGGANGLGGGNGRGLRPTLYRYEMSAAEKSQYIRQFGKDQYDRLPAQRPK